MKAVVLFFTVVSFLCLTWLMHRAWHVYLGCRQLHFVQQQQQWLLTQCQAHYVQMSQYADCDEVLAIANKTIWSEIQNIDSVQAFFLFPALLCCLLWIFLYLQTLYKK